MHTHQRVALGLLLILCSSCTSVEGFWWLFGKSSGEKSGKTSSDSSTDNTPYTATPAGSCSPKNYTIEIGVEGCEAFRKVCFDGDSLVITQHGGNLPDLKISNLQVHAPHYWGPNATATDVKHHQSQKFFLDVRHHSPTEKSRDLQNPVFSKCTVPLVIFSNWMYSFEEYMIRVPTRLNRWKVHRFLDDGYSVVLATPKGIPVHPFQAVTAAPYTPYEVTSFADFASDKLVGKPSKSTAEGVHVRCFEQAFVCRFIQQEFNSLIEVGENAYNHMVNKLKMKPPPNPAKFTQTANSSIVKFKVLIEVRPGPARQLLNIDELVEACNKWFTFNEEILGVPIPYQGIECRPYTFANPDKVPLGAAELLANMVAVRNAHVVVAVHGAGCVNAFFGHEGTSLVEVRPYQYGSKYKDRADWYYPRMSDFTQQRIRWYGINIEDPALSEAGKAEVSFGSTNAHPLNNPELFIRDRHVRLPVSAFKEMIRRVAQYSKSQATYLKARSEVKVMVEVGPGGKLRAIEPKRW